MAESFQDFCWRIQRDVRYQTCVRCNRSVPERTLRADLLRAPGQAFKMYPNWELVCKDAKACRRANRKFRRK